MPARPVLRRLGLAALVVGVMVGLTACDPPVTVATTVAYDCQINPHHFLLGTFSDTLNGDYETTAPQAVGPSSEFEITVKPKPFTVNASTGGGTVSELSNVVWRIAVPAGTTLVSHSIADWSNIGPATPTATVSGSAVVITVPGPVPTNVASAFPTLTMKLTTTGALGTRITPTIAGTSYASPGLSLNAKVTGTVLGTLNPTLTCFPSPSVALHDILISNDIMAPKITVTSPTVDQVIVRNAVVPAGYSCNDGSGVGVATCVGTVANGAAIDTSTLGAKTFTVRATDLEGKVSTQTVAYTVVAA